MKILICQAPWKKKGHYGVRAGSRWPHFEENTSRYMPFPFFMAYSAALLEKNGFEIKIIDSVALGLDMGEFIKEAVNFKPHLIFQEISANSLDWDTKAAELLKERDMPLLVWGGLFVHDDVIGNPSFSPFIDFFIQGEFEITLLELAKALKNKESTENILGLKTKIQGKWQWAGPRTPIEDIEILPWPEREKMPMEKYHDCPGGIPEPSLQVWASRGCPYNCLFCAWPQIMYGSRQHRPRDLDSIIDEINYCVNRWDFKSVYFDDDTFNIGKERMLEFCQKWVEKGPKIPWAIMARGDIMDKEILEAMAQAGLFAIKYGVESANQGILKNSGKALNMKKLVKNIKLTKALGIKVHLTFMFGLPGETERSIKKTVALALYLDPDSLQMSMATPFIGSEFHSLLKKEGWLINDMPPSSYDGYNNAVISTPLLTAEKLERLFYWAQKRWQKHLFYRNLMGKARNFLDFFAKKGKIPEK